MGKTFSKLAPAALLLLVCVPFFWSLYAAIQAGVDLQAWRSLFAEPQAKVALYLSLWTGATATVIAVAATAFILAAGYGTRAWERINKVLSPMLAVPHAAFAIGLVALVAPSGWVLRAFSPWATGLNAPPPWLTTQDPMGFGLIAVLVCKEIPFLLWAAMAHLQRPDVAQRLQRQMLLSYTMGYSTKQAWWRVAWPQLLPRLYGPILAVFAYGLTVVDVALVIGPTTPPTLGVLAWQWLQDADPATNAQGIAAAWLLAMTATAMALCAWLALQAPMWRVRQARGLVPFAKEADYAHCNARRDSSWLYGLGVIYLAVLLSLAVGSFMGNWPFPQWLPESVSWAAWQSVVTSGATIRTTLWLGLASSAVALLWCVAWIELAPKAWFTPMQALLFLPMMLPPVIWVVGLHRFSLNWSIDASASGLWIAHTLSCLPYVMLTLQGPYRGFDVRLAQVSASLGRTRFTFLALVKWPLLRAALAASFAVGFAVSVAQYLPTLYIGAGRFNTVTTEAVSLAAGGQRTLSAAYAWLQWMLPMMVFAFAAWLGQARRFGNLARQ
jgi:putative thiamine transport system permease protein